MKTALQIKWAHKFVLRFVRHTYLFRTLCCLLFIVEITPRLVCGFRYDRMTRWQTLRSDIRFCRSILNGFARKQY